MVSHNTEKLQQVSRHLNEMDIEKDVGDVVERLGVNPVAWPIMALPFVGVSYGVLRGATEDATGGLDKAVTGLGEALSSVADHYQRQEEQYGDEWDALGDEGGG